MRLPDDDEIYDVDGTYLGPPGRYLGRLRYKGILVGPCIFFLGLALVAQSGLGYSLLTVGLLVIGSTKLTGWIVDHTSQERPIAVLVAMFGHELTARRLSTRRRRTGATRAFRTRTTQIGDAHALPLGRRRWRSYANRAATARTGA